MNDNIAIKVENVSKVFKLPLEKQASLKGKLINFNKRGYENLRALKDVSFEIKKGEFFGIVGRNGSGKSTLLKLLAGIYAPTQGSIQVNGKLTPFIELGVGFNPELSGRDNVFLNGALLGFNRKEMSEMYDDIVAFAELEKFMDQKLKNYSSGMQVRLAFSIAIRTDSPILLLDEVLAVGDEAFQKKCMDIFEKYKADKKTVVLVTHDMGMVERFCSRAVLINSGNILAIGDPEKISLEYTALNLGSTAEEIIKRNNSDKEFDVRLLNKSPIIKYGEELNLFIDWKKVPKVKNIGVAVFANNGEYVHGVNSILEKFDVKKMNKAVYKVKANLGNGSYFFKIGLFGDTDREIVAFMDNGPIFMVRDENMLWQGITSLDHVWELKNV